MRVSLVPFLANGYGPSTRPLGVFSGNFPSFLSCFFLDRRFLYRKCLIFCQFSTLARFSPRNIWREAFFLSLQDAFHFFRLFNFDFFSFPFRVTQGPLFEGVLFFQGLPSTPFRFPTCFWHFKMQTPFFVTALSPPSLPRPGSDSSAFPRFLYVDSCHVF